MTNNSDLACTIDSVTVEGCRIDRNSKACKVKRNVKAAINIAFTPDFDGNDITMMAYAMFPAIEKSFPDMDANACGFMTCPVVKGTQETYSYGLKLASSYPLVSEISPSTNSTFYLISLANIFTFRVCLMCDF